MPLLIDMNITRDGKTVELKAAVANDIRATPEWLRLECEIDARRVLQRLRRRKLRNVGGKADVRRTRDTD